MSLAIEWHTRVDSTQDLAHRRAEAGAPHGAAIAARIQTLGRGTRGRAWTSGEGGLWMSVIGRPAAAEALERVSLRVGLGLAPVLEAAAGLPPTTVRIKWPNDLVARDRKLGGILCEARWHGERPAWVVVGVGVNLANELPPSLAAHAVRLADLGAVPALEAVAEPVRDAVCRALERTGPLDPAELGHFAERDWLRGRPVNLPIPGRLHGLGPDGRLRLRKADGEIVELLEAPTWADLAGPHGSR